MAALPRNLRSSDAYRWFACAACFIGVVAVLTSGTLQAQARMYSVHGPAEFGVAVASIADVDRDGHDDVIVGAPEAMRPGVGKVGVAWVISGKTAATLYTLWGEIVGSKFGTAVAAAGDVDRDQVPDILVGAPVPGEVFLYSGATGKVIRRIPAPIPNFTFGWSVAGLGDIDKDGHDDFAIGAPEEGQAKQGALYVYSGGTGRILTSLQGTQDDDRLGWAVCGLGDLDSDTVPDFAVAAPFGNGAVNDLGRVDVVSGRTFTVLRALKGETGFEWFGYALSSAGDVDKDGASDLIIGAHGFENLRGRARVISGRTGTVIRDLLGAVSYARFGYAVSSAGDVNKDGYADVAIGSPNDRHGGNLVGSVQVYSLQGKGKRLWVRYGSVVSQLGYALDPGDTNRDGVPDLVAGRPYLLQEVSLLSGKSVATVGAPSFGSATIDSTPWALGKPFTISGTNAPANQPGFLFLSLAPALPTTLQPGFVVHIDLTTLILYFTPVADAGGNWSVPFVVPNIPELIGFDFAAQAAFPANTPLLYELTPGLIVHVPGADDHDPPTIQVGIQTPLLTNNAELELPVTITDASPTFTTVYANGKRVWESELARFVAKVPLVEGPNQVEIRCTDGANNVAEPLVLTDITLDTTKPQLFSLIPRSKEAVATKTFTVSGQSTEALKGITVNSQAVPLGLDKKSFLGVYKVTATGPTTLTWIAEDLATNKTTTQIVVSVSDQPEVPSIVSIPICGGAVDTDYRYQVVAIHPNPLETLTFSLPVAPSGAAIHPQTGLLTWRPSTSQTGPQNITVRVTDTAQKYAEQAFQVDVVKLPPDPVKTAPPLSTSSATPVSLASAFLYTDKNDPIQHLEDPKVIDVVKAGVVRGRVTTSDGSPLPGVRIAVNGHPEYGWTLSRADGIFDIAVNGDRTLTINFEHPGFIPAQRPAYVSAQDYGMVADVAMIRYDPIVTPIDVTPSAPLQVARSSLITDSDGTRRATLLFKPGTTALLQIGKDALPLSTLSVRATEFSVGPSGSERMPAPLPAQVGYTYCVGLSADEARTQDCGPILLSQPAFMYLENFLNFPVGEGVPAGRYDYEKGAWEPSDDGLVLKVLSITAEMADIDIDGSNTPATPTQLAAIGIEDAERKELAQLYPIGQTLWRVAVPQIMSCHLLTEEAPPAAWDYNFPWGPRDPDAIPPNGGNPRNPPLPPPPCDVDTSACTIKNFTQVLLERVPIVGTPFTLNYSSERVPGYARRRTLRIPLSADKIPASLSAIELAVSVAGTRFTKRFPPAANLSYTYTWDGNDVYGRPVLGTRHATVDVGFVYPAAYQRKVPHWKRNFMTLSGSPFPANPGRREITIWKRSTETLHAGGYASAFALSGWSLDTHHSYEPGYSLTLGTGNSRDAYSPLDLVASVFGQTFAGSRFWMGADGFLYTMGNDNSGSLTPWRTCILRIAPDGKAETIFLSIRTSQFGSGATDKDGNIYICYGGWVSGTPLTVAHVDPTTGVVTRLAGDPNNFEGGFSGDDGPALAARINYPTAIALDPDGSILFVDSANFRIRKITPDGYIHTVAGNGSTNVTGDGGPAINAGLGRPEGLAIDNEGNIYVTCGIPLAGRVIRRISPDGIIRRIAGNGGNGLEKEGLPALSSPLNANSVQLDPSGTLFFGSGTVMPVVHRLSPEGLLHRVAGDGVSRTAGIGGLARAASFPDTREFAVGPTAIFIRDHVNDRVFKVASSIPEFNWDDTVIPSADGRELFCFDRHGKHFRTVDAFLASIRYAFQYTPEGLLADCTDGDGNVTKIVRDASGNPIEIVGPYGHVTKLETDANGYLSTIEDPNGERRAFSYTADGLLVTMSDPAGNRYTFEYDELGRLTREDDPAGGCQILNRQEGEKECTITRRTAVGRATVHKWEESTAGTATTAVTSPDGTKTLRSFPADGNFTATFSDGTKYDMLLRPDPRFGMNSGVLGRRNIVLPSTLTLAQGTTRSATLAIAKDPLSVVTATSNTIVNGRSYSTTFDKPSLTYVNRSPEARISTSTVDAKGRVTKWEVPLLDPVYLTYDARGRLATLQTGPATSLRNTVFSYDVAGNLSSLRDPASRLWQYSHDLNGRLTTLIFPSAEKVLYQYDKNGNVVSITPPGRPAHGFTYTALGQIKEYIPPSVGSGTWTTTYRYNRDRQLEEIERPDAQKAIYQYDPVTGKLTARILPNGTTTYSYDANTGNLVTIANPAVTLSFEYDGFLRTKTTWAGAINGSVSHQYDTDFAIVSESVNGGHTVTFEYDKDKLLTRAGSMTLAYDSQNGLLTCTQLGAVHDLYAYNSSGEVVAYTAWHSTSTLYSYQLSRDNLGRITAKTEYVAGSTTQYTYTYDLDGRLVTVNRGAVTAKYAYDANGNRTSYESGTTLLTGTYDAQDRLLTYGTKQFEYTRSGELLKITDGTNVTSLDYCILGNLMKVVLPGGKTVEYVIDGRGRRVGKKVDGKLVKGWLYKDGLNLVAEVDENGAIVSRFVYGRYRHVPDLMVATKSTYRLLCDHLGSPRLVVDTATSPVSTIAQSVDYDEYGIVFRNTAPEFQPFGFCGGLWEDETGLGRFGWRDYMAVIGRWTARDPILFGGGSPNIYIYVGNSPTNCVDPAGAKILVCNRRAGFPIGLVGNHAFLWDTVNEEGCGMSGSSGGNQSGPTCGDEPPPDPEMCAEVEGSEGKEKDIMDWMRENANTGPWIPWYNDCHKKAQEAIEGQGLGYPGAPGGRFPPL